MHMIYRIEHVTMCTLRILQYTTPSVNSFIMWYFTPQQSIVFIQHSWHLRTFSESMMSAWNRSSLGPWGHWMCWRAWEQSSVATRLRLHWCLQCARVLQAVHWRSAREGSPGNRTMKDRPGNEREWKWRWEWYSNYEWSLPESLLWWSFVFAVQEWGAGSSALSWLHFVMFLSFSSFSCCNVIL